MILFLSSWHILIVIGVFLGASAFLGVTGIVGLLWGVWKQIEKEQDGWEQAKRDRRSAAARKGHETRRAKQAITPDDAVGFIRGEDQ